MYPRRVIAVRPSLVLAATFAAVALGPSAARAHFVLQSPPASFNQNALGDPQKAPPCGDDGSAVASGMVTSYKGGDTITIEIDETIFHPGHYRIAIAVNDPSELPAEPPVTPNDTPCGTAPIMDPPVFPVLADGVFEHTQPFGGPQSIDIQLPADLDCANCTLQVIQFMSNHGLNNPGGCYYHHCANISVQSVQGATTGGGETSGSATSGGATSGATAGETTTTTATSGDSATGDATAAGGGSSGEATATGEPATGGDTSGGSSGEGGCGCTQSRAGDGPAALLGLLALLGLRRRRA